MNIKRNAFTAGIVLLIMGCMVFSVLFAGRRAAHRAQDRAEKVLLDSAAQQALSLRTVIGGQYQFLEGIAQMLSAMEPENEAAICDTLAALGAPSLLSDVLFIRPDGTVLGKPEGADLSDRIDPLSSLTGVRGLSCAKDQASDTSSIVLSVPVCWNGAVGGVLSGTLDARTLRQTAVDSIYGGAGFSYIMNAHGRIIMDSDNESFLLTGGSIEAISDAITFPEGDSIKQIGEKMSAGESGAFLASYGENARIIAFAPLGSEGIAANDWFIFCALPQAELSSEIAQESADVRTLIAITVLVSVLAVLLLSARENESHRAFVHETEETRMRAERFRIVAEQSGRNVFCYDIPAQTYLYEALGEPDAEGADTVFDETNIDEMSKADYSAFLADICAGKSPVTADILLIEKNGGRRWNRFTATALFDPKGVPKSAVVSYYDCTEMRARELAYAKWQQELAAMPKDKSALFEWNLTRDISESESGTLIPYFQTLPIESFDERTAVYSNAKVYGEDRAAYQTLMSRGRLIGAYHSGVFRNEMDYREILDGGRFRWMHVMVQLVPYPDTEDVKAYITIRDIDQEKRQEMALIARSEQDELTGVWNRTALIRRFGDLLASQKHSVHVLMMLDIDGFKLVNDTYGHAAGDEMLKDFVKTARSVLRTSDFIARIGGDEFMICLPDMPYEGVLRKRATQLCTMLYRRINETLAISVSIGIALYPRDGMDFETLYACADTALYHAKNAGKNRYAFYKPEMGVAGNEMTAFDYESSAASTVRRFLLIISDDKTHIDRMHALFSPDFTLVTAKSEPEAMSALARYQNELPVALLDMNTSFSEDVLRMRKKSKGLWNTHILALLPGSDEAALSVVQDGAAAVLPHSASDARLINRVNMLVAFADNLRQQIQTSYQRMQSAEEERYREVVNATGTIVFVYDYETRVYSADALAEKYFPCAFDGREIETIVRENEIADEDDIAAAKRAIALVSSGKAESADCNVRCLTLSGQRRVFRMQIIRMKSSFEMTPKVLITLNDVNDKIEADHALKMRAERDPLTGLYNRDTFLEIARGMIEEQAPGYYVLACFDIDNFKVVNDQFGREEGNRVLMRIAQVTDDTVKQIGGVCCRIFADMFAALYPYTEDNIKEITEQHNRQILQGVMHIRTTISVGRYIVLDKQLSTSSMYDRAMLAKASIKGRYDVHVAVYNENMREKLLVEQEIIGEMDRALANGEFLVWYQPQFNHATGVLIGAEALVRWNHPKKGIVPPTEFIPVFEKNGFIYALDKYVWEQAAMLLRRWMDAGQEPLSISVNVSRYDIFQPDFFETMSALPRKYALPDKLLRLEITETAFAKSTGQIIDMVKRLKQHGFIVEIDDFGSGYSSLNTLKDVPADVLKLDMRFLAEGDDAERGGNILSSVVRMAKWLNMPVIAEGVETREQADFLKSIGCEYVQGYLYGRAMPEKELLALMKQCVGNRHLIALETIDTLNNNAFWDPKSMETLIFNSYVGGAVIFEFCDGRIDLQRVNAKFMETVGAQISEAEILRQDPLPYFDAEGREGLLSAIARAVDSDEETSCEMKAHVHGTDEYLHVLLRVIARSVDRTLLYGAVENVSAQRLAENDVLESAEQLRFLNDTARDLLVENDVDEAIYDVLGKVLNYFNAERAYVFEIDWANGLVSNTYEVCTPGVTAEKERLQRLPISMMEVWFAAFSKRNHIDVPDVNKLGDDRKLEREILKAQGIRALIAVPLRAGDQMIGFVGVDDPRQKTKKIGNLEALGDYLAIMINRRDLGAMIKNENAMLDHLVRYSEGGYASVRVMNDGSAVPVLMNDGFMHIVGMTRQQAEDAYRDDAYWGVHPEDKQILADAISTSMRTQMPFTCVYRLRHSSGEYVWVKVNGITSLNADGTHLINVCYTDINAEKQTERMREDTLDHLPCGVGVYEIEGQTICLKYLNAEYYRLLGRTREQSRAYEGTGTINALHPDDRQALLNEVYASIRENRTGSLIIRIMGGSGYVFMRATGTVVSSEGGKVTYYVIYNRVEPGALKMEDMLSVALKAVMATSPDLSFVKDAGLRYVCCTKTFANMVGLKSETEIAGKTDYDLFEETLAERYMADDRSVLESGKPIIERIEPIPSGDGAVRYSATSKYLLYNSDGSTVGLYGTGRDVTASIRLAKEEVGKA